MKPRFLHSPGLRITALTVGIIAVFLLGCAYLEVDIDTLFEAFPGFVSFFLDKFIPADFSNILHYIPYAFQTVLFAIVSTYISVALALIISMLMSEAVNPWLPVRMAFRALSSFLRNIPVLIWASLLVYAFGVGNLVGLLALILATLGFLSRSFAESLNDVPQTSTEALRAAGASRAQIVWHGLLPNFMPSFLNWTLYAFEINIRASTILGMVGAGGIGVQIQTNIRLFKYHEALSIILIVVVIVLLSELATNRLRSLIR